MENKNIKAVIFDWAGTTVDYGSFAPVEAFSKVFRDYKVEATMEEIRKPMGMLKWDHIKTVLEMPRVNAKFNEVYGRNFTTEDVDKMYAGFEDSLFAILKDFGNPKPYVIETVAALREKGIKIGSTTGYTDSMMAIVTKAAEENGYKPDAWFSPDSTNGVGRPFPFMVYRNMEALKLDDIRTVIKVGDTISDIKEGKNAGMFTIGIIEGSSEMGLTEEEYNALSDDERKAIDEKVASGYMAAGADAVIQDMRGLLEYV